MCGKGRAWALYPDGSCFEFYLWVIATQLLDFSEPTFSFDCEEV